MRGAEIKSDNGVANAETKDSLRVCGALRLKARFALADKLGRVGGIVVDQVPHMAVLTMLDVVQHD